MATSTVPSIPMHHTNLQRSFTLASKLSTVSTSPVTPRSPEGEAVETLFIHHRGKIVSFRAPIDAEQSRSASISGTCIQSDTVGLLPWRSHTERTLAAGLIRVYRVPGSVAFLNSGKTVHAILPKSQCWCVDGETKFVLRIRNDSYYRIELPNEGVEDRRVAEDFKAVLAQISQYETTPCPFKRGFYIELPESPETPKRPWRPKHLPSSPTPVILSEAVQEEADSRLSTLPPESIGVPINQRLEVADGKSGTPFEADADEPTVARKLTSESELRSVGQLVSAFESRKSANSAAGASPRSEHKLHHLPIKPSTEDENTLLEAQGPRTQGPLEAKSCSSSKQVEPEHCDAARDLDYQESNRFIDGPVSQAQEDGDDGFTSSSSGMRNASSNSSLSVGAKDNRPSDVNITRCRWLEDLEDTMTPTASKPIIQTRSITAPSDLSKDRSITLQASQTDTNDPDTISIASSIESFESFHSFHSPISPLPPSPPYCQSPSPCCQLPADIPRIRPHTRDTSELTINAEKECSPIDMSTPTWPSDSPITPVPNDFLHGSGNAYLPTAEPPPSMPDYPMRPRSPSLPGTCKSMRRRAHSPLPSPANLYIPQTRLSGVHLTSVILQKTYSLLLGPPAQLVALMLNVAAKIAVGSLTARTFTYNESGQPIPCSWGEDENEDDSETEEDGYGISLGGTPEARSSSGLGLREKPAWGVD